MMEAKERGGWWGDMDGTECCLFSLLRQKSKSNIMNPTLVARCPLRSHARCCYCTGSAHFVECTVGRPPTYGYTIL